MFGEGPVEVDDRNSQISDDRQHALTMRRIATH
jgi:hypothetical protein